MTTNLTPVRPSNRALLEGQVGEVRITVDATKPGPSSLVTAKNSIPAGSIVTNTLVLVQTAFSAGAALVVGSTPGASDLVAAADSAITVSGARRPDTASALGKLLADTPVYGSLTGTPAAGLAEVVFLFVAPRA